MRLAAETKLDELPPKYEAVLFKQKCEALYMHVFNSYFDNGRSDYSAHHQST